MSCCCKCIDFASPGNETYCGVFTFIVWILVPCVCCCPLDQRPEGTGTRTHVAGYDY